LILKSISKSANLRDGVFAPAHTSTASGSGEEASLRAPSTIVVGAGPTGLSAAYHLGEDALLLEQNNAVGGWCRSVEASGFTFDYAGHIMFSNEPYVHQLYKMLLGDNVHWQDREAWIYSKDVYTRYPFQGSLYGLPANVIKECIIGAIEARFGSLKPKKSDSVNGASNTVHANGARGANGHANGTDKANGYSNGNGLKTNGANGHCKVEQVNDCCADGILESTAALAQPAQADRLSAEPRNFEEFIYKIWGAGIAKHFAIPYNKKLWAVPLSEMETSWLGGRVPMPDLEELIEGALSPSQKPMGPNARFGYPLRGGFQALMEGFLPHLKGQLRLNSRVSKVSPGRHELTLDDGTAMKYEHLISTMPLPVLIRSMGDEAPREIREAAQSLRHVSVRCVHIGVGRENITDKHWIYYPEDTVFHRIFVQGNASPHCNPPGGFGFTCEITYSLHKPLPCDGDALIERCIEDARRVGFIRQHDPIWEAVQCDLPYAYVVYDHGRTKSVARIREWLSEQDIILAGRYSEWEYYNSDHAFIAGQKAAGKVKELKHERLNVSDLLSNSWELSSSQV
jgi:UDP-galactopyranose mutase